MKFVILLAFVAVAVAKDAYDPKFDGTDINAVVANEAALKEYNNCFIGAGPCNEIQAHFRNNIGDAIQTACTKCTEAQKKNMYIWITGLEKNNPEAYTQFKNHYDPENKFFGPLAENIRPVSAF